jgi:RimJ/RimL family protein N-acetyltransferase
MPLTLVRQDITKLQVDAIVNAANTALQRGGSVLHFLAEAEFERAESDDAVFATFHEAFMRENCQDRLTLRPFFDGDIALMERWLTVPHVSRWYPHPEDWLNELHERRDEFRFITHFIAEYEGVPVGFCQYYDCHFAQAYEVWNEQWRVSERKGEVFSLDYLIGEPEYLRRGLGKGMILQMLDKLRRTGAKTILVQPEEKNIVSCRVLESCGFQYNGEDYVMNLEDK